MIDHPVCTFIILNNDRIMSRSYPFLPISFQHKFPVVFKHILPVFINIRTKKVFRTPNYHLIRSIHAIATTTNGSKQIIISVPFVNISAFVGCSCHFLGRSTFFEGKSII